MKETLPEEILAKMHAAPKPNVPIINAHDLPNADGLMFGFPTRHALLPCCCMLAQPLNLRALAISESKPTIALPAPA